MLTTSKPAKSVCSNACAAPSTPSLHAPAPKLPANERYLHRRRQVKDVDFGLSFPIAPAEPSFPPSAPHISPQAQLPPSELRESIQTPTARQSSLRSSVRLSHSTSANDANTSAKRRKLDTDSAPSSSRSTRSGIRNAPRRDVNTVEEISRDEEEGGEAQESYELEPTDVEISMGMNASHGEGHDGGLDEDPGDASLLENSIDEEPSVEVTEGLEPEITAAAVSSTMASRARTKSPLPLAKSFVDLVTESPRNAPGSGRRTRVALQANSLHTDSQLSEITQELRERTTTTQKKRKRAEDAKPVLRRHQTQTPSALDELDELSPDRPARQSRNAKVVDEEVDERSPEQPAHRDRKAKTVEDQGDYMDEEVDELSPEQPARRGQKAKITVEDPVGHMDENTRGLDGQDAAEEIDDEQAAVVLKKNQSRRTSSRFAAASPELGSSAISSFKTPTFRKPNGRPRVDQSPAQQRHPKKAPSKPTSKAAKKTANKQHVRAGEPIDIVVHRLVGVPIYDENETDAEILNAEIPHIKRAGVNTIDVLSEVSQEIIDSGLNTLEDMGNGCQDKAARREYKTKYDAVESFKRELHVRLLEHVSR